MGNTLHGFNCCAKPTFSEKTPSDGLKHSQSDQKSFESDHDIAETLSSDYLWEQVFLSHSAKQRDFVEQLYVHLTRANISCCFDRHSFFNPLDSSEALETCKVAIVVVSEDYIASELSMLQLCAFVQAQKAVNSKLKIYPLFYEMSPDEFSQKIDKFEMRYPESWSNFEMFSHGSINLKVFLEALKALRSYEEPLFVENDGTVHYRHKLLCDVHRLLSPNIQGKERLWQVVAKLSEQPPYYKNGVKVIGLYGIEGSGKTTLCNSLCGFYSDDFKGNVFHAEFHKDGLPVETLRGLLQILTGASEESLKLVGNYEQALSLLKQHMSNERVLLCLDNIPDRLKSVKEAQAYLTAGFGEGSLIVLTARSVEILERVIPEAEKRSFVPVPNLYEEEAIDVLLNLTGVKAHNLTSEERHIAADYADMCRFGEGMSCREGSYHPLALTVLGSYLCEKFSCNPSQWLPTPDFREYADAQEFIFHIFEQTIDALGSRSLRMLLLLIFYVPNLDFVINSNHSIFQWIADVCPYESNDSVRDAVSKKQCLLQFIYGEFFYGIKVSHCFARISKVLLLGCLMQVYHMKSRGLIESRGRNSIAFHDLLVEFGKSKLEWMGKWLSVEGKDKLPNETQSIVEVLQLKNYASSYTIPLDPFGNVSVVHLERVWNLVTLDFEPMKAVRSITIIECNDLQEIQGLCSLSNLRFLQVEGCESLVEYPEIEDLEELRHLHMRLSRDSTPKDGIHNDLYLSRNRYSSLEEVYLDGIHALECSMHLCPIRAVTINNCYRIERLDLRDCRRLQWIRLWNCERVYGVDLTRCINLGSIYVHKNDCITEIVGLDELLALEELHFIEMNSMEELPSFQRLGNLRHLTLFNMAKLKRLPDVSNCCRLTKVDIDTNIGETRVTLCDASELNEMQGRSDRIRVY